MLPAGALYAHKTGQLEGVENDAGIVLMPDRTFALAVFAGRRWSHGWARVVRDRGHPVPLGRFVVGGSRVRVDLLEAGN